MAKQPINRTKFPLEDNIKRIVRLGGGTVIQQGVEFATREETDAGVLTTKAIHPDGGAYAYDRLRKVGKHTAGKATTEVALFVNSGSATPNCALSNVFRLLVTGDVTLANPINPLSGQVINIILKQDDTGGHTITLGGKYTFAGGTAPTLSTGAGEKDLLSCQYDAVDDAWLCSHGATFSAPTGGGSGTPSALDVFATPAICQGIGTGTVTSVLTTVSVSGGTPPYTYAWEGVTGDALEGTLYAVAPTSAITTFRGVVSAGNGLSGAFRCRVTDSAARTGSVNVSALLVPSGF